MAGERTMMQMHAGGKNVRRRQSQRWGGGYHYLKNIFIVWSWFLLYMLETSLHSSISKKPGEIPICGTFLAKKNQFWPILFHCNLTRQFGQNRQLWRHCDVIQGMFVLFSMYEKKRLIVITVVPNKYTSGVFVVFVFCLVRRVTKTASLDEGLTLQWWWWNLLMTNMLYTMASVKGQIPLLCQSGLKCALSWEIREQW